MKQTNDAWWEALTPEQVARYGELIDSRVRLLGEYYGTATERVRECSEENRRWILGGTSA